MEDFSQTYINNNIYTKTEVDGLIAGGGGYTDTQIDSFLSFKKTNQHLLIKLVLHTLLIFQHQQ